MKTHLFRTSLLAAIAAAAAFAQSAHPVKVNVPFDFVAGNRTLQAGEYTVKQDLGSGVLTIRSDESSAAINVASYAADSGGGTEGSRLVFHRYGNIYFLSEVWEQGRGRELPKAEREMEMMPKRAVPAVVAVAIR